jgi:hypothetical protein
MPGQITIVSGECIAQLPCRVRPLELQQAEIVKVEIIAPRLGRDIEWLLQR